MSGVVVDATLDRCFVKAAELSRQEHPRVDDESVAKVAHVRGIASSSRPHASLGGGPMLDGLCSSI